MTLDALPNIAHLRSPLASHYENILHTYHDIPAWSRDSSKLLYVGFNSQKSCDIVIRDIATHTERSIAKTEAFDLHVGAWQQWALNDTAVLYRDGIGDETFWSLTFLANGNSERIHELDGYNVRHLTKNGTLAICTTSRFGTESSLPRVSLYDLEKHQHQILFTSETFLSFLSNTSLKIEGICFDHTVLNASGNRLFFKIYRRPPNPIEWGEHYFHSFAVFHLDTGHFTNFGSGISGHPTWLDETHIVNIQKTHDGFDNRWLVSMDTETGHIQKLANSPIEGAGHPAVAPNGRWLIADSFSVDGLKSTLYFLDLKEKKGLQVVDTFNHFTVPQKNYNPQVFSRIHPHPVWSPDSKRILCNSNGDGSKCNLLMWELGL